MAIKEIKGHRQVKERTEGCRTYEYHYRGTEGHIGYRVSKRETEGHMVHRDVEKHMAVEETEHVREDRGQ
jgi:hypothetical protein